MTDALTRLADAVEAGTPDETTIVIGIDLARGDDSSAAWEAHPIGTAARVAELETLLARQLVFDHGAAEDALDALGGWNRMCDLVTAYREANPLPESDIEIPISGDDGGIPF